MNRTLTLVGSKSNFKARGKWDHYPSSASQSLSSDDSDWEFAQSIVESGIASPNLVTYITTPDGTVYEYGIDEQNTNQVGCEV